jgi:hypothetical protein
MTEKKEPAKKEPATETAEQLKARLDPRLKKEVKIVAEERKLVDLDNEEAAGRKVDQHVIVEATPKRTYLNTVTGTLHEER